MTSKEHNEQIFGLKEQMMKFLPSELGEVNKSDYFDAEGNPRYGRSTFTKDKLYSHPRVWVNEKTLPSVVSNLKLKENNEMYERVVAQADLEYTGILEDSLTDDVGVAGNRNFGVTDSATIESLAFMYLTSGDELYGYKAILAALNFLKTVKVRPNKAGWDGNQIYDISNQCATATGVMAEVYDWCYELLTPSAREYIVRAVTAKLTPTLEVANPPANTGCVTGHSTSTIVLRDWLTFAVAVADEHEYIYNHMLALIEYFYAPAPNWYYPSGANFQGSAYGINKTYLHMLSELIMKVAAGGKLYAPDVSFEATIYTYINYIRPDGESLRLGDDYNQKGTTKYWTDIRMPVYGSFYYKNPMFKSWAMALTDDFKNITFKGLLETTPIKVLLFNDPTLECDKSTRYNMPLVNYNGTPFGAITARSAWGDENAWMTYSYIGEAYGANHAHKDSGTFQIYYKGILAPQAGAYQYLGDVHFNQNYGDVYDFSYVKQTVSKNGLLIYNPKHVGSVGKWEYSGGQDTVSPGVNNENPTLDVWLSKKTCAQARELAHAYEYDKNGELTYAYIYGDITKAYPDDTVELVTRATLSVATKDKAHPLLFITHDIITAKDKSFKKTYLLHTTDKPEFAGGTETVTDEYTYVDGVNAFGYTNAKGAAGACELSKADSKYNGKLTVTTLLPENPKYAYIGGDGHRFWVNGKNLGDEGNPAERPVAELGWGRVEISPSTESETDSFLNVMYVGDADRNDEYVPAKLITCTTHEGAVTFGNCIMFPRSEKPVSDKVTFETDGESLNYYITGLCSGEWTVSVNGKYITAACVSDKSGILSFKASAGRVELNK